MKPLAVALLLSTTLAGCSIGAPDQEGVVLAGPSGPVSSAGSAACTFTPVAVDRAEIKDVGRPPAQAPAHGKAVMSITTNLGGIEITMDAAGAPCATASFAYLAGKKFFDGTSCHRLTAAAALSVLQCGDPAGNGTGGPAYQYAEENLASLGTGTVVDYKRGVVGVARTNEPGSSGSQFFFMIKDGRLPPDYTPLGTTTRGLDVVDQVAAGGITPADATNTEDGSPKTKLTLQRVTVAYN